nr:PREDICTED: putative nuclease HARBI1 [Daucus carota subsp. sativus]
MANSIRIINEIMQAEEEETEAMMTMMGAVHLHRRRQRENRISRHGGSIMNHRVIDRNREDGHNRLYHDYFSDTPTYTETQFRRRFRMRRPLFLRIEEAITAHDTYFIQRIDAVGARGLSSLQKMTAAVRMLAYGTAADAVDDYVRIGESTAIESLKRFVKAVVEIFGPEYLRRPNDADVARLLAENEERGFPGMLGSIDCMHWKWKNCPTGWQGMYTGHVHEPTIILEAIASKDLWIWHSFFGLPGSLNDINVLDRSHLFEDLAEGRGPELRYTINGHEYNMGYYLADGIYPSWPTFVKTIPKPQGNKRKYFATAQESTRKDVERAFGVLQARFAMIRGPSRFWDVGTMKYIMTACIILHNMIVEDERELRYKW